MGVTSVRLNPKEEKLVRILKDHYNCDTSTLMKRSLWEMYEDLIDKDLIEDFEKREKGKKTKFISYKELVAGARKSSPNSV